MKTFVRWQKKGLMDTPSPLIDSRRRMFPYLACNEKTYICVFFIRQLKHGSYYVITLSARPFVCMDVCLSVNFPCLLHIYFIDWRIFLKICSNVSTQRRVAELINQSCQMMAKVTLQGQISNGKIFCTLYNFNTFRLLHDPYFGPTVVYSKMEFCSCIR